MSSVILSISGWASYGTTLEEQTILLTHPELIRLISEGDYTAAEDLAETLCPDVLIGLASHCWIEEVEGGRPFRLRVESDGFESIQYIDTIRSFTL